MMKLECSKCQFEIERLENIISENGAEHGYSSLNDWITYVNVHRRKLESQINLVDSFQTILRGIVENLESVINGKRTRDEDILDSIRDQFQRFFLATYDHPEYLEYVFDAYKKIIGFDIANRSILLENKNSEQETRSLDDFSSGEKAYAFIRAMMSIVPSSSKFKIMILDESNALLDYIRSGALLKFQKELVNSGKISKLINIIPVTEDVEQSIRETKRALENTSMAGDLESVKKIEDELERLKVFRRELASRGYYQEPILT